MARKRQRKPGSRELPPPLPPETRTVGQLVAESIRFYGRRFWPSLALGLGPAVTTVAAFEIGAHPGLVGVGVAWLLMITVSYVGACVLVSERRPRRDALWNGFAAGVIVALPLPLLTPIGLLPAVLWLALVGLAVPAAVLEGLGIRAALVRGYRLGRADYVHAAGSLAALGLVVFLVQTLLFSLLRSGSDQAVDVAGFLASLVISPLLFVGAALLYDDQAARARVKSGPRPERSSDADVPDAVDPDRPGSSHAPVESRSAAGGQPGR